MAERTPFARWLERHRGARSIRSVERATKVHRSSIIRAERGERLLRVKSLVALCDHYGASRREGIVLLMGAETEREIERTKEG